LTTKQQEEYVSQKVKQILSKILTPGMNDHKKLKAIHDYIVSNVAYDKTKSRFSAYYALIEQRAVCQGYALLAYKMLTEVGIDARIVSGITDGGEHSWNMVKLDGNWYHINFTWNDPVPDEPGRVLYDYYNLTDNEISKTHKWDHSLYPAATTPYDRTKFLIY